MKQHRGRWQLGSSGSGAPHRVRGDAMVRLYCRCSTGSPSVAICNNNRTRYRHGCCRGVCNFNKMRRDTCCAIGQRWGYAGFERRSLGCNHMILRGP